MLVNEIFINTDFIELDNFLKWARIVPTGGEAKFLIKSGEVFVNGKKELRRSKKLYPGDVVEILGNKLLVSKRRDD